MSLRQFLDEWTYNDGFCYLKIDLLNWFLVISFFKRILTSLLIILSSYSLELQKFGKINHSGIWKPDHFIWIWLSISFLGIFLTISIAWFSILKDPQNWVFASNRISHTRIFYYHPRCCRLNWHFSRRLLIILIFIRLKHVVPTFLIAWITTKQFLKFHVNFYFLARSHLSLRNQWAWSVLFLLTNRNINLLVLFFRRWWNHRFLFLLNFIDFLLY